MNIREMLNAASPVMPVATIDAVELAVPLGQALLDGGLRVVEVTLRTEAAIDCIAAMRECLPDLVVGAGTVLRPRQMGAVADAGGQFAVSPGYTETLAKAAHQADIPFLPGAVTASEIQSAMENGLDCLKLYPAAAVGGPALLSGYAVVFPHVRFCPTGGINSENMPAYLALSNVVCVGGSWITPPDLLRARDWDAIRELASEVSGKKP